jgi:hypothetical protein
MLSGLLGLLAIYGCNSTNTPSDSSSPSAANANSGTDRWVGQWQVNNPSSSQAVKFVLTPEGKLFLLPPETSSESPLLMKPQFKSFLTHPLYLPILKSLIFRKPLTIKQPRQNNLKGKRTLGR